MSEIGGLRLRMMAGDAGLRAIEFSPEGAVDGHPSQGNPVLQETERQLRPILPETCASSNCRWTGRHTFQQRVWRELLKIPYGETRSYGNWLRLGDAGGRAGGGCGQWRQPRAHRRALPPRHRRRR